MGKESEKKAPIKYIQMHNKNETKIALSYCWMVFIQQPGTLLSVSLMLENGIGLEIKVGQPCLLCIGTCAISVNATSLV